MREENFRLLFKGVCEDVRLILALRRQEICEQTGDDDEDEADDQACATQWYGMSASTTQRL